MIVMKSTFCLRETRGLLTRKRLFAYEFLAEESEEGRQVKIFRNFNSHQIHLSAFDTKNGYGYSCNHVTAGAGKSTTKDNNTLFINHLQQKLTPRSEEKVTWLQL